jgi:hypothetical protein
MLMRKRGKGILKHCWWECKLEQPPWKSVWRCLKNLKLELSYDPGIYPKERKSAFGSDTCTPVFITYPSYEISLGAHQLMNG